MSSVRTEWPDEVFHRSAGVAELQTSQGGAVTIDCRNWHRGVDDADRAVLSRCRGPVLDIGCGPGRHVAAVARLGAPALGIDASQAAVSAARRRGAPVIKASVFEAVPREGWWGTALLLDGNVGIGGDVTALLRRASQLLEPGGRLLVETAAPDAETEETEVRVRYRGGVSGWFPWAWVTPLGLALCAQEAGLLLYEVFTADGRWFVRLDTSQDE